MPSLFPLPAVVDPAERLHVCVPVPNEAGHRQAFLGALWNLARWYSWARDTSETGKQVAEVWREIWLEVKAGLQAGGDCEMTLELRQNPSDPCELQTSNNGIDWTTVYDGALCFEEHTQGIIAQQYQQHQANANLLNDRYQDIWDANPTPTAINPNTPTTNWNGANAAADNNALCSAANAFVRNWAAIKVQQFDLAFGSILVGIGLAFALIPGIGWAFATAAAITLIAAALPVGVSYSTARAALTDETALDAVSCCMNTYLKGKAITQANFQNSLSGCGFAGGSYSAIVRDILAGDLANNWLMFIDLVGGAKTEILAGRTVYCPCVTYTHILYDFVASSQGFVLVAPGGANRGVYSGGNGWQTIRNTEGSANNVPIHIRRTIGAAATVVKVELDINVSAGTQDTSPVPYSRFQYGNDPSFSSVTIQSGTLTGDHTLSLTGSWALPVSGEIRFDRWLWDGGAPASGYATATIKKARVYFSGSIPTDWGGVLA